MKSVRITALAIIFLITALVQPWRLLAQGQAPEPAKGVKFAQISAADMQEWLTYLSSDTLQGRQIYTEGYGLAAAYIADHLKEWGVKPLGDNGTYFQSVKMRGYRVTRNSSVTIEANGQTKTFKDGDHVTFPANAGGKQTLTFNGLQFVGNGMQKGSLLIHPATVTVTVLEPIPTSGLTLDDRDELIVRARASMEKEVARMTG